MTTAKKIKPISVTNPRIPDKPTLEKILEELILDINTIVSEWNDNLYPLLATLPGGRERVRLEERDTTINPVNNGLDGSQLFVDTTSSPRELGGLLHNGSRPKTIRETFIDVYATITSKLNQIEGLINNLSIETLAYDDSEIKAWITQLAGETWDPDDIAAGASFNTGNFTGDTEKTSAHSLSQKINLIRTLLGVEAEDSGLSDISEVAAIAASNYLSEETDIIEALVKLDSTINGLGLDAATLQGAYDNSLNKVIDLTDGDEPIELLGSGVLKEGIILKDCGIGLQDDYAANPGVFVNSVFTTGELTGTVASGTANLRVFLNDPNNAATEALRLTKEIGTNTPEEDRDVTLSIGKPTAGAKEQNARINLGRDQVGSGGDELCFIDATVAATTIEAKGDLDLVAGQDLGLTAGSACAVSITGDALVSAQDITIEGKNISINTTGDLAGEAVDLAANTTMALSAAQNLNITSTDGSLLLETQGVGANSVLTASFGGAGESVLIEERIASEIKTTGDFHNLELRTEGDGSALILKADDGSMWGGFTTCKILNSTGPWSLDGNDDSLIYGLQFRHYDTLESELGAGDEVLGLGTLGTIKLDEGSLFADSTFQGPATSDERGLVATFAAFEPSGWAPHDDGVSYGGGSPDPYRIYRDNVIKAKGSLTVDVSENGNIAAGQFHDIFNVDVTAGSSWDSATGIITIVFETPLSHANYSVTMSYGGIEDMIFRVNSKTVNQFVVACRRFNSGAGIFQAHTSADTDFTFDFQVV